MLSLCLLLACNEAEPNPAQAEKIVAGGLSWSLPNHDERASYVCFTIERRAANGTLELIASSGYRALTTNPVKFSLTYRAPATDNPAAVSLITRIAADPQGLDEITTMRSPILDDQQARSMYLAIELPPEPLARKNQ